MIHLYVYVCMSLAHPVRLLCRSRRSVGSGADVDANANPGHDEYQRTMSPVSHHDNYSYENNNTLKLDAESLATSPAGDVKDEYVREDQHEQVSKNNSSQYKDNYETTFDLDGNVETKSICSAKSGGSGHENR